MEGVGVLMGEGKGGAPGLGSFLPPTHQLVSSASSRVAAVPAALGPLTPRRCGPCLLPLPQGPAFPVFDSMILNPPDPTCLLPP